MIVGSVEKFGSVVLDVMEHWGRCWVFLFRSLRAIFLLHFRWHLFLDQLRQIGFNSIFVISLIAVFTGAVLAVQADYTLSKFGATAFTGPAVALSLIRELGPVLTALMIIGRAGSAITAEIGIMRITEQIDALRSMAVDPIRYLMAPRILAGFIATPLLTGWFIFIGIVGGYIVSTGLLGLSSGTFITQMESAVTSIDVYSGFIKAAVFGLIFGWVSCYKGYYCGFGAVGVNKATTQAVVAASVAVLVVDYFLTAILTRIFMN
jgi:phospholipid/cholesterol/gamma-HCH transport system permease protein